LRGTPGDQERFVWVDMLCYGFGEARNARKSSVVDRAAAAAALAVPALNDFLSVASVLQRVERVEVLLTQPEAPPALRSLNCVFELFVGAKLNLPIVPLMVPEEREFLKSLVVSGQANADFFATLRGTVNLTKPRDASQELIVGKIAQLGDQVVRAYVHQVLKACFLDVAGEAAGGVQGLSVEAQRVHHAMGLCHQTFGNVVDAQAAFEKSIEAGRAAFGPEHRYVVQDLMDLGNLLYVHGSYEAALLKYEEALAIKTKQLGGMHKDVSRLLNRVGMVHKSMGNRDAAREKFAAALEADKDLYGGNDHPEVASDLANLGQLALDGNDYGEAKRCFELAFQIDSKVLGASHPDVAIDLANLGTLASIQGNFAEAEPLFTRALQLRVAALGEDALLTAQSQNILAYLWRKMGSEGKAMELGGRALDTYEEKLGPSHAFTLALAELWDGA
jgi:tetratricopeptide (TPR) repeat protein